MTTLKEELDRLKDLDVEDLILLNKAVVQLINEKRTQRDMVKASTMHPGMKVKFYHNGIDYEGDILKVNMKTCRVNITSPNFKAGQVNVSINMLEVI